MTIRHNGLTQTAREFLSYLPHRVGHLGQKETPHAPGAGLEPYRCFAYTRQEPHVWATAHPIRRDEMLPSKAWGPPREPPGSPSPSGSMRISGDQQLQEE